MRNTELIRQADRIYALISESESKFEVDDELRSHIAKYICILCSGFLENAVYHIFYNWVCSKAPHEYIQSYTGNMLKKVNNPNSKTLSDIAKLFNPDWDPPLKEFLQAEERSSAINYIIRDRHKIAHGGDSDITLLSIKTHFDKVVEVISFIEDQLSAE